MNNLILLLIISIIGPLLGAVLGIIHYPSKRFMYSILAFAAGVMLAVSFINLIPESVNFSSMFIAMLGIALGAFMMSVVDRLIPHIHPERDIDKEKDKDFCNIHKSSTYINIALFIHNLPEGMVIALGTITNNTLGIIIAIAITVQKIPEGICTAAPTYYCNKNRLKSFFIAASTLLPLIIGFFIAYVLYQSVSSNIIGLIIGMTAGFMIYISADELIPSSSKIVTNHSTIISLMIGILFVLTLNVFL